MHCLCSCSKLPYGPFTLFIMIPVIGQIFSRHQLSSPHHLLCAALHKHNRMYFKWIPGVSSQCSSHPFKLYCKVWGKNVFTVSVHCLLFVYSLKGILKHFWQYAHWLYNWEIQFFILIHVYKYTARSLLVYLSTSLHPHTKARRPSNIADKLTHNYTPHCTLLMYWSGLLKIRPRSTSLLTRTLSQPNILLQSEERWKVVPLCL